MCYKSAEFIFEGYWFAKSVVPIYEVKNHRKGALLELPQVE